MTASLDVAAQTEPAEPPRESTGTLDFLLRRMHHKSDFPALSGTISAINQAVACEDRDAGTLAASILKDFALTTKLLKMVNTAYYGTFGGTISTVTKAVVILGFERVRTAAITLMLFEHLQDTPEAARLKDDLVASYFSGILARQLVTETGIRNAEEAFICATFHTLGRLLTSFYLPEEHRAIEQLMQLEDLDEMLASLRVLGLTYEDLGVGVAKAWNFAPRIVHSMRSIDGYRVKRPQTEEEKLRVVADFAAAVCDAIRVAEEDRREQLIKAIVAKFGESLGVDAATVATLIKRSAVELAHDAAVLHLNLQGSAFLATIAKAGEKAAAIEGAAELQRVLDDSALDTCCVEDGESWNLDTRRQALLLNGIQDITATLMGDFKLNDVLREILELMYRSIGFTRVLLFVRDAEKNALVSRFGLGAGVDALIHNKFAISLSGGKDVFQAAVANGSDVFIEDVHAETIRRHIPDAYRKAIPARSLALFPIVVRGKPIGLFYGDSDVESSLQFSGQTLALLKTLRNQAVLAIKQTA